MKHRILAYTFIIMVFAATVSLLYYFEVKNRIPTYVEVPVRRTENSFRTYRNDEYGFEIQYPKTYNFQLAEPGVGPITNFVKDGIALAQIAMPNSLYENTNFGGAWANLGVRENATKGQCQTYRAQTDELELMEDTVKVGDNIFYTARFDGAAAGTRYSTVLYRTRYKETCYELELTTAIANIQVYEPGAKTEVDEDEIWERLNDVAETFKFTN